MRRRILFSVLAATGLLVAAAPVGLAQPGGLPDALGPLARAFGLEVAADAQEAQDGSADPDGVSASVARAGGMPQVAELTGEEFGQMVSGIARSAPGAAAEYFRGLTPSPAAAAPLGRGRAGGGIESDSSGRPPSSLPDAATNRPGAGRP
jgi:hypothetical protein